jgi:hypothetical protein
MDAQEFVNARPTIRVEHHATLSEGNILVLDEGNGIGIVVSEWGNPKGTGIAVGAIVKFGRFAEFPLPQIQGKPAYFPFPRMVGGAKVGTRQ